jgi:DNA-binding CsgD family transcriptional regulator/tetratricopeptide (TPR) repeat protein
MPALLNALGMVLYDSDVERSREYWEQSLELAKELGDRRTFVRALNNLACVARDRGEHERATLMFDEALAGARFLAYNDLSALVTGALANLHERQGNDALAIELNRESLKLYAALGGKWGIARMIERLAVILQRQGHARRAAYLFGAGASLRARIGATTTFDDEDLYFASLAAARAALGNDAFDAAWDAGGAMTLEEAIAYALTDAGRPAIGEQASSAMLLTPRELDVLRLIVAGQSNREIADALFLSVRTVERHIGNVHSKLGTHRKSDAAVYALRHNLV